MFNSKRIYPMKRIMFVCAMVLMSSMAFGQTKKACCKGKKACTKTAAVEKSAQSSVVASAIAEAELAANADETVEKRVCSESGSVSFHQKNICEKSGSVSYSQVNYDPSSKTFVKAAEMEASTIEAGIRPLGDAPMPAVKKCSKGEKAACAKKCAAKKGA